MSGAILVGFPIGLALFAHASLPDSHTFPFLWVMLGAAFVAAREVRRKGGTISGGRTLALGTVTGAVAGIVGLAALFLFANAGTTGTAGSATPSAARLVVFLLLSVVVGVLGGAIGMLLTARRSPRPPPFDC